VQTNKIFFNVIKARQGDMTHLAVQEVVSASVGVGEVKAILILPLLGMFRSFQFRHRRRLSTDLNDTGRQLP
jgi:hypothetical protein